MADQLQEMLQKIYAEGVDKAKAEADKIIEVARQEADKLKSDAQHDADRIIKEAKQKAAELDKNINSDLKMAAQQAMSALKQNIINSVLVKAVEANTDKAMQETGFLQKLILEVLGKWSPDSSVVLTVPENKQIELEAFFKDSVKGVFSGTLKVDFSPVMKSGITIAPADGTFKLNFTDEDFANFFKSYLRPKAAQILFGE
jgi:V/A-type H+/Na+-transporting ATPase subunit E